MLIAEVCPRYLPDPSVFNIMHVADVLVIDSYSPPPANLGRALVRNRAEDADVILNLPLSPSSTIMGAMIKEPDVNCELLWDSIARMYPSYGGEGEIIFDDLDISVDRDFIRDVLYASQESLFLYSMGFILLVRDLVMGCDTPLVIDYPRMFTGESRTEQIINLVRKLDADSFLLPRAELDTIDPAQIVSAGIDLYLQVPTRGSDYSIVHYLLDEGWAATQLRIESCAKTERWEP